MANKKLFFGVIPQNGTLTVRCFESQKVIEEINQKQPNTLSENNVGWVDENEVDLNRMHIIKTVDQYFDAPQQQGINNQQPQQQSQLAPQS
jgi:hypothetical protein